MRNEINFQGCFMRNEKLPLYGSFIVNLDDLKNKGSHWVAVFGSEYYDSFGMPPPIELENRILTYNTIQHQTINSVLCALFACLYIHYRNYGYSKYDICYNILKYNHSNKDEFKKFIERHKLLCRL